MPTRKQSPRKTVPVEVADELRRQLNEAHARLACEIERRASEKVPYVREVIRYVPQPIYTPPLAPRPYWYVEPTTTIPYTLTWGSTSGGLGGSITGMGVGTNATVNTPTIYNMTGM